MHNTIATMNCGDEGWDESLLQFCSGECFQFHNCHHDGRQIIHNTNGTMHCGTLGWDDNNFITL